MNPLGRPVALVVHESMFGNTATIADAVARGLALQGIAVSTVDVAEAPAGDVGEADLLVIGGPTHAFSLSRPGTRADAVRQGADPRHATTGLREWIDGLPRVPAGTVRLSAVFDTRVSKVRRLPKSAGTRAGHLLQARGYTLLERPMAFVVADVSGPLLDGEAGRAVAWGRALARECEERLTVTRARSS